MGDFPTHPQISHIICWLGNVLSWPLFMGVNMGLQGEICNRTNVSDLHMDKWYWTSAIQGHYNNIISVLLYQKLKSILLYGLCWWRHSQPLQHSTGFCFVVFNQWVIGKVSIWSLIYFEEGIQTWACVGKINQVKISWFVL